MKYLQVALTFLIVFLTGAACGADNSPTLDAFITEEMDLLSPADSAALSTQTEIGVNSATKVQPVRPRDDLPAYTGTMNSTIILANFPLTDSEQKQVNEVVDDLLGKSKRVKIEPIASTRSVVYSAISVRKKSNESAMLEVLVGVADWPDTKKRNAEGVVQALRESTVWFSASRKQLLWRDIADGEKISFEKTKEAIFSLYGNGINSILVAF